MIREYAVVIISVLTLVVAAVAVYGIDIINTEIQARPDPTKTADYSAQLDSINSQINSIKNDLAGLNDLKASVSDANTKLAELNGLKGNIMDIQTRVMDLENKSSQVQQVTPVPTALTTLLDKSTYFPGDTIRITAIGAKPQNLVQIELLDNSQFILVHQQTLADAGGKVTYGLQLSSAMIPGNYLITLVSDKQTNSQPIKIQAQGTSQSTATGSTGTSGTLTVQTDKSVYQTGQLVQVSGKALPNTIVSSVMTSPSGKTYTATVSSDSSGSYLMFFSPLQPYEVGKWSITVNNLGQTSTVYLNIQS